MSRLRDLSYDQMSDEQKRIHDNAACPRGAVVGPLRFWLHSPALVDRAQKLGAYLRYHSEPPPHLSELAILVTGSIWKADFEWYSHVGPERDASIAQYGCNNAASVSQIGNDKRYSLILNERNLRSPTVTQTGGATMSVTLTGS